MTHSPPVPPGNQSPYPLQEPPHEHQAPPPDIAARREHSHANEPVVSGAALGIGLAIGLGSAALLATWLFSRKEESKPRPKARSRAAKSGGTGGQAKSSTTTGGRAKSSRSNNGGSSRGTTSRRRKTSSDSE